MVDKSEVSAVSRVTTSGRKKKHCRECKKVFAGQHWANHLKSVHKNGDSPGFDFCTETEECVFCKDIPTKSSSNRNKYYLCPACPHRKLVRADTAMGKTGKCKCGAQLVLSSTAKSVIDEQIPEQLAEVGVSDSVSQTRKRPAPVSIEALAFEFQDGQQESDSETSLRQAGVRKVGDYLAKQDLFKQSSVLPQVTHMDVQHQHVLSLDTSSISMSIQVDSKPLSTSGNVVSRLQSIEKSTGTPFASVTAAQNVQYLCISFLDEVVYRYMQQQLPHTLLRESVKVVQQRTLQLNTEQAAGILFASFVLGGDCLPGAIKSMLTLRQSGSFENVSTLLMANISKIYGEVLGRWIELHWEFMNSIHLKVMSTMKQTLVESDVNLLTLLMTVTVSTNEDLQILVQFVSHLNGEPVYEHLLEAIEQNPKQAGITQRQFFDLIVVIQDNQFQSIIEHLGDDLLEIKLCDWVTVIKDKHQQQSILNASSAQQFIKELMEQVGDIPHTLASDLRQRDPMIGLMFNSIHCTPNERQFAAAQYALGASYTQQRQIWIVPSGQGKSRIIASMAYLGLKSGMYTKVVIIFSNEDLMKRDQADFADMWHYFQGAAVAYQVGISATQSNDGLQDPVEFKGALVIVDEADDIMYANPSAFHAFIQGNCCVAFTATPDDGDANSVEATILKHMAFKRFDYIAVEKSSNDVQVNAIDVFDKASYVVEQLSSGPVLLFCDKQLAASIQAAVSEDIYVSVCPGVNYQVLRTLDQKIGELYRVAVCVDEFGFRGLDYRSPNTKLTLVIAKSFMHQRDQLQGVKRVGRFNDPFTIVRFSEVPLIDTAAAQNYKAKLFQFCTALLGKAGAVQLKAAKVNKVPVPVGKVTVPSVAQKMSGSGLYKSDASRLQLLLGQKQQAPGHQTKLNFVKPVTDQIQKNQLMAQ